MLAPTALGTEARLVIAMALGRVCESCHAARGQRCRRVRQPGTFHLVRLRDARRVYEAQISRVPEADRERWRVERLADLSRRQDNG